MSSLLKLVAYGVIGLIVLPLGLLWLLAGASRVMNLQAEMAGARSDYLSDLVLFSGLAMTVLVPLIMFVRTPLRR